MPFHFVSCTKNHPIRGVQQTCGKSLVVFGCQPCTSVAFAGFVKRGCSAHAQCKSSFAHAFIATKCGLIALCWLTRKIVLVILYTCTDPWCVSVGVAKSLDTEVYNTVVSEQILTLYIRRFVGMNLLYHTVTLTAHYINLCTLSPTIQSMLYSNLYRGIYESCTTGYQPKCTQVAFWWQSKQRNWQSLEMHIYVPM